MTPKEKANELVSKFVSISLSQYVDLVDGIRIRLAKECALIAVDELIESFNSIYDASIRNIEKYSGAKYGMKDYWDDVKQEIKNL